MEHTVHDQPDGVYHRFPTDRGTVWVIVRPLVAGAVTFSVFEQESALAAIGKTDEEAQQMRVTIAQRNRFGTGRMLKILRSVRTSMPEIRRWVYERKAGANAGRIHERVY